jgi:RNA recognition motif-containing protein
MAGKKLFVGSLPDGIAEETLQATFQQYGQIEEIFVKPGCPLGKQCAFVTFTTAEQAAFAKESCDRTLTFPGAARPCEVMVARNQGLNGQQTLGSGNPGFSPVGPMGHGLPGGAAGGDGPRKIHVGSLPDQIQDWQLKEEFSRFGVITEVHVKQNCEPGRQWAFVSFQRAEEAVLAKESTDRILSFPGSERPCEVVMARNQGMFGHQSSTALDVHQASRCGGTPLAVARAAGHGDGPRKILVGSLPDGVSQDIVRSAFEQFGTIVDIYVKQNCEPGRQWAFVSYTSHEEAQNAKIATDKTLVLPGGHQPCEVLFARSEGGSQSAAAPPPMSAAAPTSHGSTGDSKIFVGSMPGNVTENMLRAEFSRYGHILDAYVKADCEPGRQWGFVTFAQPEQANHAKESTDRILYFPGADRATEVMIARSRNSNGQSIAGPAQQLPANTAASIDLNSTTWRIYHTKDGHPYYHNHVTNVTQWERPRELQPTPARRYSPY